MLCGLLKNKDFKCCEAHNFNWTSTLGMTFSNNINDTETKNLIPKLNHYLQCSMLRALEYII